MEKENKVLSTLEHARKTSALRILNQKKIADEILAIGAGRDICLAGGAPRNWFSGIPANDLDFFIMGGNFRPPELWAKNIKTIGSSDSLSDDWSGSFKKKTILIDKVVQFNVEGETIQFIHLNQNECRNLSILTAADFAFDTFDFDICKVFYNNKLVVLSGPAKYDFQNKTLTIRMGNILKFQRIKTLPGRAAKIQGYYPDHKIRILE